MANRIEGFKSSTVFGGETVFTGTLRFDDSLKIKGRFEGIIESPGSLLVDAGAVVVANIKVGSLLVRGTIRGNVQADQRLEILDGGHILGNIRCPNLVMTDGTTFQGQCEMLTELTNMDVFSLPVDRLKKDLLRVK